ncbi:MAG: DNA polymerase III subunit gamma/tau [Bacteroidales bacterium]|nr:DNA polymerase III subunit gamma/tau [Bacteroidales bacterium]
MDSFVVSARKYRPASFRMVVGQDNIVKTLKNAIINNHLAQAFLFTGPRGVGKTTCARIMAKTINCTNLSPEGEACNECASCLSFNNSASFNIHELDAASNNSVEDIRNLVEQVRVPPQEGKYKIYIIDEVHMLSQAAFNAFLKTLEEPPSYAKFILATTERHKIIPTILSRCQIYNFKRITVEDIAGYLKYVAESEGVEAESDALHIIAQKADGAMRDALSLFDQMVTFSGKEISYRSVIENLNILDYDNYFQFVDFFVNGDYRGALVLLNEITSSGFDGQHIISGLSSHIRNLLMARNPATVALLEAGEQMSKRYSEQAARAPEPLLTTSLDMLTSAEFNYRQSNVKSLFLENLMLQLSLILTKLAEQSEAKKKITEAENSNSAKEPETPAYASAPVKKSAEEERKNIPAPNKISIQQKIDELKKNSRSVHQSEPFDRKKMLECWSEYCESIKTNKINLYSILVNSSIDKTDNDHIAITVDGPMKKAEIEAERDHIIQSMRKKLSNDEIMLKIIMTEKEKIHNEISGLAQEKLNEIIEKYPDVSIFVETLNLNPEL